MLLSELLKSTAGIHWSGKPDVEVRGITYDSRQVKEGDLFVAIQGENTNGARFIDQAIRQGAVAIAAEIFESKPTISCLTVSDARKFLAESSRIFYQDPTAKIKLVGITGTNGKTTTSYLMNALFKQAAFP
jgi:UDP-N-acetylmuramoyl-L-alanyl-D-glutamate--2,6-diaminopimelate ligase